MSGVVQVCVSNRPLGLVLGVCLCDLPASEHLLVVLLSLVCVCAACCWSKWLDVVHHVSIQKKPGTPLLFHKSVQIHTN
jgi:hypothetical protein